MNRSTILYAAVAVIGLGIGAAGLAQSGAVSAALANGSVGEQADGYLGFRSTPSGALRAEVEAINIKRRAAYTDLAAKRGVTVSDMAAATGCKTLASRVGPGQAYLLNDGVWRIREGTQPIPLPDYCATAG